MEASQKHLQTSRFSGLAAHKVTAIDSRHVSNESDLTEAGIRGATSEVKFQDGLGLHT